MKFTKEVADGYCCHTCGIEEHSTQDYALLWTSKHHTFNPSHDVAYTYHTEYTSEAWLMIDIVIILILAIVIFFIYKQSKKRASIRRKQAKQIFVEKYEVAVLTPEIWGDSQDFAYFQLNIDGKKKRINASGEKILLEVDKGPHTIKFCQVNRHARNISVRAPITVMDNTLVVIKNYGYEFTVYSSAYQ